MDPEITKGFQELQAQVIESRSKISNIETWQKLLAHDSKVNEAVLKEFNEADNVENKFFYQPVGRMLVRQQGRAAHEFLLERKKQYAEKLKQYKEIKEVCINRVKESENSLRELVNKKLDSLLNMIFLGGSCNPTTWRQSVAIPYLDSEGITYYNPQVENWTPEVVDLEKRAKRNAELLLFVIDRQTRSTVSLVESAFLAGYGRNLVLVIYPFERALLSNPSEYSRTTDIMRQTDCKYDATGLVVNRCQSESTSAKRSSSSVVASSTIIAASSKQTNTGTSIASSSISVTSAEMSSIKESEEYRSAGKHYEKTYQEAKRTSNVIRINGEEISSIELFELEQARLMLQALAQARSVPLFPDIVQALRHISSSLADSSTREPVKSALGNVTSLTRKQGTEATPNKQPATIATDQRSTMNNWRNDCIVSDIYLSLDSDDQSDTKSHVIPLLKERGLKYNFLYMNDTKDTGSEIPSKSPEFAKCLVESLKCVEKTSARLVSDDPICTLTRDFTQEFMELVKDRETCAVQSCRIFLFVITNRCRGLPIMVLASHFMALFQQNVVLCIQHLEEPCTIAGETLSRSAIADYNRGRIYLKDYAMEFKVPIFTSIREAIDCCSHKCSYNIKH